MNFVLSTRAPGEISNCRLSYLLSLSFLKTEAALLEISLQRAIKRRRFLPFGMSDNTENLSIFAAIGAVRWGDLVLLFSILSSTVGGLFSFHHYYVGASFVQFQSLALWLQQMEQECLLIQWISLLIVDHILFLFLRLSSGSCWLRALIIFPLFLLRFPKNDISHYVILRCAKANFSSSLLRGAISIHFLEKNPSIASTHVFFFPFCINTTCVRQFLPTLSPGKFQVV